MTDLSLPDERTLHDAGVILRPRRITDWPEPRVRREPPRSLFGIEIGGWSEVREIAVGFVVIVTWAVLLAFLVPVMFTAVQP